MRHRKSGRHLNRTSPHRQAMLHNMSASLFRHELIRTTLPKAKELRRVAEPLITLAKEDSVDRRRRAFAQLRDSAAVGKLFTELGPRYKNRPGGYLRILKAAIAQATVLLSPLWNWWNGRWPRKRARIRRESNRNSKGRALPGLFFPA